MDTFTHFEDELSAAMEIDDDFPLTCGETMSDSEEEEQEEEEEEQEEEIATENSFSTVDSDSRGASLNYFIDDK